MLQDMQRKDTEQGRLGIGHTQGNRPLTGQDKMKEAFSEGFGGFT